MFVLVTMNLTENSLLPHFHSSRCKFYRKKWNMSAGRWCCNTGWELYFAIVFFSGFIIMAWSVSPVCSHKVFDRGTGWEIKSGKEFIHGGRIVTWDTICMRHFGSASKLSSEVIWRCYFSHYKNWPFLTKCPFCFYCEWWIWMNVMIWFIISKYLQAIDLQCLMCSILLN